MEIVNWWRGAVETDLRENIIKLRNDNRPRQAGASMHSLCAGVNESQKMDVFERYVELVDVVSGPRRMTPIHSQSNDRKGDLPCDRSATNPPTGVAGRCSVTGERLTGVGHVSAHDEGVDVSDCGQQ